MITKIESLDDVKIFARQLIVEGVSFHPDDDFNDYINIKENKPTYTKAEANLRNDLMNSSFDVCKREGVDIYDIMLEISLIETGMDRQIPLPSQSTPENN